jgi:hypothetical protein
VLHFLSHILGLDDPSGRWYLAWSGFFSDKGAAWFAVAAYLRHHNCHSPGCWRLGKHRHDGTPYVYCRTHHPEIPTT